jgi:hypothetical protein
VTVRSLYSLAVALGIGLANSTYADSIKKTSATNAVPSANQQLANAVADRISKSGVAVGTKDLNVTTKSGVVTLTGTVKNPKQAEAIVQQALSVPGVERVDTSLKLVGKPEQQLQPVDGVEPAPSPVIVPGQIPPGIAAGPGGPIGPGFHGAPTDPVPLATPGMPAYDMTGPKMPPYAWPTYAPYPNYSRVAYPEAYPYNAFPFIGPYYPFPKVPLGWRSVKLEWDDGHWYLGRLSTPHDYWRTRFW